MQSSRMYTVVRESGGQKNLFKYIAKNTREIWLYRFALYNFVSSSIRNRYRRSALGFVWSLLSPLLTMGIMAFVFGIVFSRTFADMGLYLFSGLIVWNFISNSFNASCNSLVYAEQYLKKVYLPKPMFPLITVATETVNTFFSLISIYLLVVIFGAQVSWALLILPVSLLIVALFNFGCALILSSLSVYFRDISQITSVLMTGLFYASPILYQASQIPDEMRIFIDINPFKYYLALFQKPIYDHILPSTFDFAVTIGLALLVLSVGLFILMRREEDIIFRL